MSDLRASIAAELAKHDDPSWTPISTGILCSTCNIYVNFPDDFRGNRHDLHRAHVATILTALLETELREARAGAWDEGHDEPECVCACHTFGDKPCRDCENPYRGEGPA